jgi:kynurenine formamidase
VRSETIERRVKFDFEIEFSNGGGIQGQDFRLDIDGEDIEDRALGDLIVRDLRLLMVREVRILNKHILREPHKRAGGSPPAAVAAGAAMEFIDLSHTIENGLVTYRGLPAPVVCDFLSREASQKFYSEDTAFQIGKIEMVANTGTYLDSPFHRFGHGRDIAALELSSLADLQAVLVRVEGVADRVVDRHVFLPFDLRGKAVLVHTGWARHWGTDRYFERHPFLTGSAAQYLRDQGAALVGIDSLNIDDTSDGARPVHTTLLGADIPIVEHLCRLEELPTSGFTFTAAPVKVRGMGTFPVRAYATVPRMSGPEAPRPAEGGRLPPPALPERHTDCQSAP